MNIETIRHSLSHIMASALLQMFPDAKVGIGPSIDTGFYYDFDLPRTLVPADLKKIEKNMRKIIRDDFVFEKRDEDKKSSIAKLEDELQIYKVELAKEISDPNISFYDTKHNKRGHVIFSDMCAGPHVDSTKDLRSVGFKLDKVSGAYWRGDEKRPMMQRIYGLAFKNKGELDDNIKMREEADKRNHRKLGKALDLFVFSDKVGPGLPMFTPKGTVIIEELKKRVEKICRQFGYEKVMTPHLAKLELYEISGHRQDWDQG